MLRLNLSSGPEWLDLGHGVRVQVTPCTSAIMAAARGNDAVEALVAAGASETELALGLAKAMAGIAILDWEGVGDADGSAIPVSPETAAALMDVWPLFEAFQARYVAKGLLLDAEKNAFAPSPSGTSVGATATARPVRRRARTAPAARAARKP
jgi:pimeloyl-ACP methyl ester carboxylesterase